MEELLNDSIKKIVSTLGIGHSEAIYHQAMIVELNKRSIKFESQKTLPVMYEKIFIGSIIPDLIINDSVIVEIKTAMTIGKTQLNQVNKYMRLTGIIEAYIVNVNSYTCEVIKIYTDLEKNLIWI